ncbi:hypothetical protein TBLA_0A08330 [Henningerozyma blattae CBS 6284]|uniref:BAH domain-containing protein n=1 Tax=Henningerozyma blattae (strain ATCC 34711 / CBS 6284 / DSM 70876 / NBRC 10599 / NRRL Y-10934 / UCD 77-7) TaxID=1071380 RepID=I2GWX0_HENB6|nr:hypothetical protein TBLA_0A08330 [Tetrapisispora blattae CBS 6284]CCH58622.1 hypothetical protein TBLA_0A08330 [Tetrapisispora blattae CBS 6284]
MISQELKKELRNAYDGVFEIKEELGIHIYPIFHKLPSKKEYPDYYTIIKNPMSLNTIKKRLSSYENVQSFLNDMAQIPCNAKIYNTDGSPVYHYATLFEKYLKDTVFNNLKKYYPNLIYPSSATLTSNNSMSADIVRDDSILSNELLPISTADSALAPPDTINATTNTSAKENPDVGTIESSITNTNINNQNEDILQIQENASPSGLSITSSFASPGSHTSTSKKDFNNLTVNTDTLALVTAASTVTDSNSNNLNQNNHSITNDYLNISIDPSSSTSNTSASLKKDKDPSNVVIQSREGNRIIIQGKSQLNPDPTNKIKISNSQRSLGKTQAPVAQTTQQPHIQQSQFSTPSTTPTPVNQPIVKPQTSRTHMKRGRPPVIDLPYVQRIKNVLKMLRKEYDSSNGLLISSFEKLPDQSKEPLYYSEIANPICLDDIKKKVKARKYKDYEGFQSDFNLMLKNYNQFYQNNQTNLTISKLLQNSFETLSNFELSKPDKVYLPEGDIRLPLDEVEVNGKTYKIGDWVLVRNPNDISKPIVAQIFRLWKTKDNKKWLNCCWYFRPEQTVHRVDRIFYKNEVMKTGQYRDHVIEDIQQKCYVVHFTRFQRGDPILDIDGPLFVCEFRYNENDKAFNKIRTWRACLPEEIRDVEEETVPVIGKKFFKYPSPIKDLLPANATVNDPTPEATVGAPNSPPLIGAVYLREKLPRDDLGEYSTSDECPRYIIRPNDPPENGIIDKETGTIVVTQQTHHNSATKTNSNVKNIPTINSPLISQPKITQNFQPLATVKAANTDISCQPPLITSPTFDPHPLRRKIKASNTASTTNVIKIESLNELQAKQIKKKRLRMSEDNVGTLINNLVHKCAKHNVGKIVSDYPSGFLLSSEILTSSFPAINSIHVTNSNIYSRRIDQIHKQDGKIVWFRGPSVNIQERYINSGSEHLDQPLNKWFPKHKKNKLNLDYEEVEETIENDPIRGEEDLTLQDGLEFTNLNEKNDELMVQETAALVLQELGLTSTDFGDDNLSLLSDNNMDTLGLKENEHNLSTSLSLDTPKENRSQDQIEPMEATTDTLDRVNKDEINNDSEEIDSDDENETLPKTFPLGLRASASFMAYKLEQAAVFEEQLI